MPLRAARRGRVGVIGGPVAKTAVVAAAVTPGRGAPVAKTAVVAAAVTPGRGAPVAKTAVVAAAVTPGRRRRRI
jgi:UDP-3-O-[3-hydroxymyristoyl] glucosamine N-acyltransferase